MTLNRTLPRAPTCPRRHLWSWEHSTAWRVTGEGEEVFRNPSSTLSFLLQVVGMDSTDRARMRRWSELAGPQTEEEVRTQVQPKLQQEDLEELAV